MAPSPTTSSITSLKEILRIRQQARSRKSCLPCRERKVRCNKEQPCSTCVKRAHADLCVYSDKPAPARQCNEGATHGLEAGYSAGYGGADLHSFATQPQETAPMAAASASAALMLDPAPQPAFANHSAPPVPTNHNVPSPHSTASTGGGSVRPASSMSGTVPPAAGLLPEAPQVMGALSWPTLAPSAQSAAHKSAFQTGLLPLLGASPPESADGMAPFTPANQMEEAPVNINATLPCDKTLSTLFDMHRSYVHPFVNITYNLDAMERFMCVFMTRRLELGKTPMPTSEDDAQKVPLLHTILASGAQFSSMPLKQRYNLVQTHST